jgi:hypothetical protein
MYVRIPFSKKYNPLLDEVESWNLADSQRNHSNEAANPETQKILPWGARNGGWNIILNICPEKLTHF